MINYMVDKLREKNKVFAWFWNKIWGDRFDE